MSSGSEGECCPLLYPKKAERKAGACLSRGLMAGKHVSIPHFPGVTALLHSSLEARVGTRTHTHVAHTARSFNTHRRSGTQFTSASRACGAGFMEAWELWRTAPVPAPSPEPRVLCLQAGHPESGGWRHGCSEAWDFVTIWHFGVWVFDHGCSTGRFWAEVPTSEVLPAPGTAPCEAGLDPGTVLFSSSGPVPRASETWHLCSEVPCPRPPVVWFPEVSVTHSQWRSRHTWNLPAVSTGEWKGPALLGPASRPLLPSWRVPVWAG